jgi:hypothetical protein
MVVASSIINSTLEHKNHTLISDFRVLSRRLLSDCPDPNPFIRINVTPNSNLSDDEFVTVKISGVLVPEEHHWVAMISPANSE